MKLRVLEVYQDFIGGFGGNKIGLYKVKVMADGEYIVTRNGNNVKILVHSFDGIDTLSEPTNEFKGALLKLLDE